MSVFLSNLDDFIAPGQACVNPLVKNKATTEPTSGGRITLETDFSNTEFDGPLKQEPNLIRSKATASSKVATVSLNDCLACSGCVTTAETMLIQTQSHDRLLEKLIEAREQPQMRIAVAISPQSRASLAEKLGMSMSDTFLKIASVLKAMGVTYVLDSASAGDVALIEAREEFLLRYRGGSSSSRSGSAQKLDWKAGDVSSAVNSREINVYGRPDDPEAPLAIKGSKYVGVPSPLAQGPMIVSHCPGWVCYAEKTLPESLPYVSTAKSSQQILGATLKAYFSALSDEAESMYVACVQPCFDKKLEASRLDFLNASTEEQEVDLVISTTELWRLLEMQAEEVGQGESIEDFVSNSALDDALGSGEVERLFRTYSEDGQQLVISADAEAGSGGYMDYIVRYTARAEFGLDLGTEKLEYKAGRNADIAEVVVKGETPGGGSRELHVAKVYGFRNIQSTMLKLKRGKCTFDLMEVMACPSGCINGGGQLRSNERETASEGKERVAAVDAVYHSVQMLRSPDESPLVKYLYSAERLGAPMTEAARGLLHTRYHTVPKLEEIAPLATKW